MFDGDGQENALLPEFVLHKPEVRGIQSRRGAYFVDISVKQFLFRLKDPQGNVNFLFSKLKCKKIKLFFLFILPDKSPDLVT